MTFPWRPPSRRYHTHCLPILSYISQFKPPPERFEELERHAVARICRVPPGTFLLSMHVCVAAGGWWSVRSGIAMAHASAIVAGRRTRPHSEQWMAQLTEATMREGPFARLGDGKIGPQGWTTSSVAEFWVAAACRELAADVRSQRGA